MRMEPFLLAVSISIPPAEAYPKRPFLRFASEFPEPEPEVYGTVVTVENRRKDPHDSILFHDCSLDSVSLQMWRLAGKMASFVDRLKGYIGAKHLKYPVFDRRAAQLHREFSGLEADFAKIRYPSESLADQHTFTADFFTTMDSASAFLGRAARHSDPYYNMFADAYELRVLVMGLFGSRGKPESSFEEIAQSVAYLKKALEDIGERQAYLLPFTPAEVAIDTIKQTREAQNMLAVLRASG